MVSYIENKKDITIFGTKINILVIEAIIIGFLFLIISWIIAFMQAGLSFSFQNLLKIHESLQIVIIDTAPIVLGIIARLLVKIINEKENKIKEVLSKKDKEIESLSRFTRAIGQGQLDIEPDETIKQSELGSLILEMRKGLVENKIKEQQNNWIREGKEKISEILRQYNDLEELAFNVLKALVEYMGIVEGAFYMYDEDKNIIINYATYAYNRKKYIKQEFKIGEGLIGEAAFEKDTIYIKKVPENYAIFTSGLIKDKKPAELVIEPLMYNEDLEGIIEIADINEITELKRTFLKEIGIIIAQTLFNLKVNYKTKKLLEESQAMMDQLRESEEELRQNAEEMQVTQEMLAETNKKLEQQIKEVENSQKKLELILENASEVISIYDESYTLQYESRAAQRILGYDSKEFIGTRTLYELNDELKNLILPAIEKVKENPDNVEIIKAPYTPPNADENIWIEIKIRNLLDMPGIEGFLFNTRDITSQIIAEIEQRRRGQMQALSENSPDMIVRLSKEMEFFYFNPSFKNMFDIELETARNKKIDEVNINSQFKEFIKQAVIRTLETQAKQELEQDFEIEDNKYYFSINIIPEKDEQNEIETLLIILHDITESKLFEQEIELQNKKITESINYAYRIQRSLLPDQEILRRYFEKSFLLYRPKDVISGDFPWMFERNNYLYIAAVDCTGHGVPGALLSFIGYFHLNNIVDHDRVLKASEILDMLHQKVRETLKQNIPGAQTRDGMDAALIKVNLKDRTKIEFAGAHRPLYLVRNKELLEYKGDRKAIGGIPHRKKFEKDFTNYELEVQHKDKIFIFTDGYPDQINENKEKYKTKRIKEFIINNNDKPMFQIGNMFYQEFKQWKGSQKQIDDILVIGIEF